MIYTHASRGEFPTNTRRRSLRTIYSFIHFGCCWCCSPVFFSFSSQFNVNYLNVRLQKQWSAQFGPENRFNRTERPRSLSSARRCKAHVSILISLTVECWREITAKENWICFDFGFCVKWNENIASEVNKQSGHSDRMMGGRANDKSEWVDWFSGMETSN